MLSMVISPSVFRRSTQSITWNECWVLSGSAMMPSSRCGRKVRGRVRKRPAPRTRRQWVRNDSKFARVPLGYLCGPQKNAHQ